MYIDMRLVEGQTLQDLLSKGPLEPTRAVSIVNQIAEALDAAHAQGLIHRDVKAQNIIVTPTDFAYLVDFGIAEAKGDTRLTSTGTHVGSYAYMAPERFLNQELTPACDVYSLACVLYEALTGRSPFRADSMDVVIAAHIATPPPRPSLANPNVPPALDEVIARGMAKQPQDRYASAGAFGQAAQRALRADWRMSPKAQTMYVPPVARPSTRPMEFHAPLAPPSGPTVQTPADPPRGRPRNWVLPTVIAIAAALLLGALGIVIGLLAQPNNGPTSTTAMPSSTTASTAPTSTQSSSSTPSATPASLTGKWSGRLTGDQSLEVVADIVDGPPLTATVNYPQANCTCKWTQHGSADNGVRFVTETVVSGTCAQSEVTLTPQNDGTLYLTSTYYSTSQQRNFNVHGTLNRANG